MTNTCRIAVCGMAMKQYVKGNVTATAANSVKYFTKILAQSSETAIFMFLGLSTIAFGHKWVFFLKRKVIWWVNSTECEQYSHCASQMGHTFRRCNHLFLHSLPNCGCRRSMFPPEQVQRKEVHQGIHCMTSSSTKKKRSRSINSFSHTVVSEGRLPMDWLFPCLIQSLPNRCSSRRQLLSSSSLSSYR